MDDIRQLGPEDWESYRTFRLACLRSSDAHAFGSSFDREASFDDDEWRRRVAPKDHTYFVAWFDGPTILSSAGAYYRPDDDTGPAAWHLVGVYTLPAYRGRGLSERAVEAVPQELETGGVSCVVLMVNTIQNAAIQLYRKLGFQTITTVYDQPMGDGRHYDEFVMRKELGSAQP